jgi:hypothetical protein
MSVLEKPKRKRRTKAEMEAARASKNTNETPQSPPKWYEIGGERNHTPKPKTSRKTNSYPKPKPRDKFDRSLIDEVITMPSGAQYGMTIETKHGKHLISYCDASRDWAILYNAQYNDTQKHWKGFVKIYHRLLEAECAPSKGKRRTKKQMELFKVLEESRKTREE